MDSILAVVGSSDESNPYQKSTALHNWLLGYEFPATAIDISKSQITVLTSVSKAKHLSKLVDGTNLKILSRTKDADHNDKLFDEFIDVVKGAGEKVGVLSKDTYGGKFMDEWRPKWEGAKVETTSDVSNGLSQCMEVKDEEEHRCLRTAARASSTMMAFFTDEMTKVIDDELAVTNEALSDTVENKIDDAKFFKAIKKLGPDFDLNQLDWCYRPIVQSGNRFELKFSAESTKKKLGGNVMMASLGLRYQSYCSNVSRTFLVDPSKEMEKNYDFLCRVREDVLGFLKDGISCKEAYNKTLGLIVKEEPELEKHFLKNIGSLTGIEFRDYTAVLNGKTNRTLHNGSVVNLVLGFQNLKDAHLGEYALMVADTVRITGGEPILLTESPIVRDKVSFYFKEEELKKKPVKSSAEPSSMSNSRILKSKLRTETKTQDDDKSQVKREIQKNLHERRQKEGLSRFNQSDAVDDSETKAVFKRYESYVKESQIPANVRDLKIHIDSKAQTIILPICGRPVPFHINAYKNGSKNEEGEYTYLRLNFNSPGGLGIRREELPYEEGAELQFVRSFTFRSKDGERMSAVFRKVSELKKEAVKRESEKKSMADVVTQDSIVENRGGRVKRLDQVLVRPGPDNKRVAGSLQIHQNGLRYQSPIRSDHTVDVLFSNMKNLFFQPCKDEMMVIIHCHLRTPIIIGKRKTFDVQFYREASDMAFDETGNSKRRYNRYGDEDELEQEQEERRRKALLDKEFRGFAEQIADASNGTVDLDVPFRELGFYGVPFRSAVFCMPTRDCLVQLVDPPFLVVPLEEVEIAHLERVSFGLKNFDLVFVFKDFSKPVVHVNTIQMEVLEDVKSWLTDVDIPISEGPLNLNWPTIMKTVQRDPYQFFVDGGWSFLAGDSDDEQMSEEEESEFEVSDENPSDEDVDSEVASESGSDAASESEASASDDDDGSEEEFSD